MKRNTKGFTLIEVLVVVLIIGVLAAIALPQYQKAVLKSRFSALMPLAKAMADSNEAYYLEHGEYAGNAQDLTVQGQENYPDGTELKFGTTTDYSYVLATRDNNFPNNYIVYQNHSEKFASNIHCEAAENNTMAQEVCQSLGGYYIDGSISDGYKTYVLSGTQTAQDKFPASITKLKAQICGTQFDEDHCIVDEKNNTITTKECANKSCVNITYDEQGKIFKTYTKCTGLGKMENEQCVPTSRTDAWKIGYEQTLSEDQKVIGQKICLEFANDICTYILKEEYTEYSSQYTNIKTSKTGRRCANGEGPDPQTLECPGGYSTMINYTYDSHGQETLYFVCDDDQCANNTGGGYKKNNSYDENGNFKGYVAMRCTQWADQQCVGDWYYNNENSCSNGVDLTTYTCK